MNINILSLTQLNFLDQKELCQLTGVDGKLIQWKYNFFRNSSLFLNVCLDGYIDQDQAKQLTLTRDASPNHVLLDEDGSVGKKFVAKTTPHMYVIDEDGMLKYQGAIDNLGTMGALFSTDLSKGVNFVREAIQSLNAGLEIESSSTRPYGCSIKY